MSNDGVGFLPGQASLAYFFLRGSLWFSGRYGAVTGVGLRVRGSWGASGAKSTSGAGLGNSRGRPPCMEAAPGAPVGWFS